MASSSGAGRGRAALTGLLLGLFGLAPELSLAESTGQQSAEAESLFRQGKDLMAQQRLGEACVKFAESHRIEPGLGTLLNLADCREKLGMTASAWADFLQAAALARRADQRAMEAVALKRAQALEPRLIRLKIVVPEEVRSPGLEVQREGLTLNPAAWGSAVPVDPGVYTLVARAPERESFEAQVELNREGETVEVIIPQLRKLSARPATIQPQVLAPANSRRIAAERLPEPPVWRTAPAPTAEQTETVVQEDNGDAERTVGLAVAGAGLVSLTAGGVFALVASDRRQENEDSARALATVGTIGLVAGGVLTVAGAAVYLLAPTPESDRAVVQFVPAVSSSITGGFAVGRF